MGARGVLRTAEGGAYLFHCAGCDQRHRVGPGWSFNGDFDRPSFSPSVMVQGVQPLTDEEYARLKAGGKIDPRPLVCHSFVTDGQIQFLGDCTHALAGQTVSLEPMEAS